MTWILIIFLSIGYGGGVATQVFHSKEACEKASSLIKQKHFSMAVESICVEDKK